MSITAQVSVYPLGQPVLGPPIRQAIARLHAAGLIVEPGVMSTVIAGEANVVFDTLHAVFEELAGHGQVIMAVTFSNTCSLPASSLEREPPPERGTLAPFVAVRGSGGSHGAPW